MTFQPKNWKMRFMLFCIFELAIGVILFGFADMGKDAYQIFFEFTGLMLLIMLFMPNSSNMRRDRW